MSDAFWVAVPLIVTAVATGVVNLFIALNTNKKAGTIQEHVNSAATASRGEIAALRNEVSSLVQAAGEKKETAAILARALVDADKLRAAEKTG